MFYGFSSGDRFVQQSGMGCRSIKKYSCEIISKSVQQFWRRVRLKKKLTTDIWMKALHNF